MVGILNNFNAKYNKVSLLSLQTIGIFIVSSVIAFMILGEEANRTKWLGIGVATIGAILLICGQ